MKTKILFLFFFRSGCSPFSGFAQTPGNMDDVQWSELAKSATSVSLTEIDQNPEKFNNQKVIVYGIINGFEAGKKKGFVQELELDGSLAESHGRVALCYERIF